MDHTYKVLVIGDPGVGKTSMVQSYVHGLYTKDYKATLGGETTFESTKHKNSSNVRPTFETFKCNVMIMLL